ncbi:MAG: F0F1 ATP synthase subunit A [Scrofimicrobium sp.]
MAPFKDPDYEVHQPGLADFFPAAVLFEGTPFEMNRLVIARLLVAFALGLSFFLVVRNLKLRPGRMQWLSEFLAGFVRDQIGVELLGTSRGHRYATILGFIFFGVLGMNLTGIIPGIDIAASSVVAVPIVFAVVAYVTFIVAGIKARGGMRFLHEQLFPAGVPWPLYILLTPIEFISTFIIRPLSLAVRLLANMMAGHMLLALSYFGTQALLLASTFMKPLSILTFGGSIVATLFEIFVAALQAYVFTVLTAVYIKMSVEAH